jgi:hypothetical protein
MTRSNEGKKFQKSNNRPIIFFENFKVLDFYFNISMGRVPYPMV